MQLRPVQVAYAVDDVERAAQEWSATFGIGPFFVMRHIPVVEARVRGVAGVFDHSSAYAQWGPVMVELVAEHSPPLVTAKPGIHHVACFVDDLSTALNDAAAAGWSEVLWARTSGGQEFAFVDARRDTGHLVEFYEPIDRLVSFYAMVADAAVGWKGTDPVRVLR